jgi:hypothetical protein
MGTLLPFTPRNTDHESQGPARVVEFRIPEPSAYELFCRALELNGYTGPLPRKGA